MHNYLNNLSTFKFILIMTLLTFFIVLLMVPFIFLLSSSSDRLGGINFEEELTTHSKLYISFLFILVVFIAPLTETFIFQWAIIKLIRLLPYLSNKSLVPALVSALVFGLAHNYSLVYMIIIFPVGLLLAYSFLLYEAKDKHPFWVVTAIHSLRNLISVLRTAIFIIFQD